MHFSSGELRRALAQLRRVPASSGEAARSSAELDFGSQWVPMVIPSQVTRFGGIWSRLPVPAKLARGCRRWVCDFCRSHNCVCTRSDEKCNTISVFLLFFVLCFFASYLRKEKTRYKINSSLGAKRALTILFRSQGGTVCYLSRIIYNVQSVTIA